MKTKLIANNDYDGVVIQCACIGHCSYVEFFKLYDDTLYMSISTNNHKKRFIKKLDTIECRFNLDKSQQQTFINMLSEIEYVHSNTFAFKDTINGGDLYIRFEYVMVNDKPSKYDQVQISYYTTYKAFRNSKPDFDYVITRPMLNNLIKELNILCNQESPD